MADVITDLSDEDIATEWRDTTASITDDDATDTQDGADGADGADDADGTDSDDGPADSDADQTDS
jgi:hypothetical protein